MEECKGHRFLIREILMNYVFFIDFDFNISILYFYFYFITSIILILHSKISVRFFPEINSKKHVELQL
jgi:hypothetical protein